MKSPKVKTKAKAKAKAKAKSKVKAKAPKMTILDEAPIPPATCPFSELAGNDGTVVLNLPVGAPDNSEVYAINIKVTDPNSRVDRIGDFLVTTSKLRLKTLLYYIGDPFSGAGPLSDTNKSHSATANNCRYSDGSNCVVPLDPPCHDGPPQYPFRLSKTLKGSVFQVAAKLKTYRPKQLVEGTIVLVRAA